MKVLICHELFPPDFAGGGERIMYKLVQHLSKKDVQVKVITTGNPKIKGYKGIKTKRLRINRYLMNFAFWQIAKQAKNADIIHASSFNAFFPTWLAGKLTGKPTVCYVMGLFGRRWLKMRGLFFGTISRIIERIQINRSFDKIVFLSEYSKRWGEEIGITGDNREVINPGVDIETFKSTKKKKFVLFLGRFAKQKGVDDVVAVAKELPNVKFVMCGWGEEEKRLREMSPKNIEFVDGNNNKEKVVELYSKAPVCFFPSEAETFGLVVIEAMASGAAIVSTIDLPYNGFKVKSGDIKTMKEKIEYLITHPDKAAAMGKANVQLAKNYTWDNSADNFIQTYYSLLKKKHSRA